MVTIAKSFTLYKLADTAFTLSDTRADRTLDAFGKYAYGVSQEEIIWWLEEYGRRHGTPTFILDIFFHYYRVNEMTQAVADVDVTMDKLTWYGYGAIPLETLPIADVKLANLGVPASEAVKFAETYWDNVLFNIHALESVLVQDVKKTGFIPGAKAESLSLADNRKALIGGVYKQPVNVSESLSKGLLRPLGESISVFAKEGRKLAWKRSSSESAGITDKQTAKTKKVTAEDVAMKERPVKAVFINPAEIVILVDAITASFNWFRTVHESLKVADKRLVKSGALYSDALKVIDKTAKAGRIKRSDSFSIADKGRRGPGKRASEQFSLKDSRNSKVKAVRSESIRFTPILAKRFARGFAETFGIMSKYASHAEPLYKEKAVKLTDGENKLLDIVRSEMVHITELYWDNVLFLIHIADNINFTDAIRKTATMKLYDSARFLDYLSNEAGINSYESVAIAESRRREIEKTLYDQLQVLDGLRRDIRHIVHDKIVAMDRLAKTLSTYSQDSLAFADGVSNGVRVPMSDAFSLTDAKRKAFGKVQPETVSMIDTVVKKSLTIQHDTVTISDSMHRAWRAIATLREELQVLDRMSRDINNQIDERLTVADNILAHTEHQLRDAFSMEEAFNRTAAFRRGVSDLVKVGDAITRDTSKSAAEDIAIYDAFVRASNAYIESIQVYSDVKDAAAFKAMADTPPMYEAFTDFNVGDYEYEKALMRLRVISNATHSQPLLYDVAPHVDIDDTDDKGQVEITDTTAATKVYYNKHYYNAPEVNAMVKGSTGTTTPVPNIITTDGNDSKGRYFEIELLNSSGNRTTGIVSWVAKGW